MGKIRDPKRFSEAFGVPGKVLRSCGAFDPILNADTLLFIDPLLLPESKHGEMRKAHADWEAHFSKLIKLLSVAQNSDDPPWRAAEKLLSFEEFRGTCLGYGAGSIRGTALAATTRKRILQTARRIIELGIEDPELFLLIPLIEEGVGPDSISDMTSHVIAHRLAEFTERVLATIDLPRNAFTVNGKVYHLPANPYETDKQKVLPAVLVPRDVLRDLPVASDWDDISRVVSENDSLRQRVNLAIGSIWDRRSRKDKQVRRRAILSSRNALESVLEAIQTLPHEAYDLDADPAGRVNWFELGRQIAARFPVQLALTALDMSGLRAVVEKIIDNYKYLIENQGVWKVLYDKHGKSVHEHISQKIFFVAADSYCKASNVDITPEANSGPGPVDFKLSRGYHARVVVELKLSTNSQLRRGYTEQLEAYKRGERTDTGYFVVLDVGGRTKQLDRILALEAAARSAGEPHSPITVIDATRKKSASKL